MSRTRWPGVQALIDFLETEPPKGIGRFDDGDGRCCLGHYCALSGFDVVSTQTSFNEKLLDIRTFVGLSGWVGLPRGHWLLDIVKDESGYERQLQDILSDVNDSPGFTEDEILNEDEYDPEKVRARARARGFAPAIEVLKGYLKAQRQSALDAANEAKREAQR